MALIETYPNGVLYGMMGTVLFLFWLIYTIKYYQKNSSQKRLEKLLPKETILVCPICSGDMNKNIVTSLDTIVDVCPDCGCVVLDKDEANLLSFFAGIGDKLKVGR